MISCEIIIGTDGTDGLGRIMTDVDLETEKEFDPERSKSCLGTLEDRTRSRDDRQT